MSNPNATLREVLQSIGNKHQVYIQVMEQAFEVEGIKDIWDHKIARRPIPKMERVPLAEVLRTLLSRINVRSGATFYVDGDRVLVTTRMHAAIDARTWVKHYGRLMGSSIRQVARAVVFEPDLVMTYGTEAAKELFWMAYWHGVMLENVQKLPSRYDPNMLKGLRRIVEQTRGN
jgi:hypothetical protein